MRPLCLLLALTAAAHAEQRLRLEVGAAFTYAFAPPGSGLGAAVDVGTLTTVWRARRASGTIDVGLELGYQNQPYALLTPYLGTAESLSGADHRVNLWLAVGHGLHVLARRLSFGVHLILGLTHFASDGALGNTRQMIAGRFVTAYDTFALAVRLRVAYRFHPRVGVALHAEGFPLANEWGSTGYVAMGLGLFVVVR